jgi:hypothetical protein
MLTQMLEEIVSYRLNLKSSSLAALIIAALAHAAPAAGQGGMVAVQGVPANEAQTVAAKQAVERVAVESRITPGAPYSAESVTESVQVLSDGNRIARKTPTRIYRDSEGRTRREQLSPTGEVQSVSISDPVAGSMFVLNPAAKTAHRNGVIMTSPTGFATASVSPGSSGTVTAVRTAEGGTRVTASEPTAEVVRRREVETQAVAAAGGGGRGGGGGTAGVYAGTVVYPAEGVSLPRVVAPGGFAGGTGTVTKEDLGTQVIEGVVATGTRTTTTIAAGSIGNDLPILIVSEQWFSADLKVLVMTKHSDPRSGETTYRLTNIVQTEPARSLFEVPADYTLKDAVIRRQSPMEPHD